MAAGEQAVAVEAPRRAAKRLRPPGAKSVGWALMQAVSKAVAANHETR